MKLSKKKQFWADYDLVLVFLLASITGTYIAGKVSTLNRNFLMRWEVAILWVEIAAFCFLIFFLISSIIHYLSVLFERNLGRKRGRKLDFWKRPSWWMPAILTLLISAFFLLFDKHLRPVYSSNLPWATSWKQLYWIYLAKGIGFYLLATLGALGFQLGYRLMRRQGRRGIILLALVIFLAGSVISVVLARPPVPILPRSDPSKKIETVTTGANVIIVAWDGASWDILDKLRDVGQVPNLERMMKSGAFGNLQTLPHASSAMIWNSVSTGRSPQAHGVYSFTEYTFPFIEHPVQFDHSSAETRILNRLTSPTRFGFIPLPMVRQGLVPSSRSLCPPLWELIRESYRKDFHAGLFDWFGTTPAEVIPGFIFSNSFYARYSADKRQGEEKDVSDYAPYLQWDLPDINQSQKMEQAWESVENYQGRYREEIPGIENVERDRFYAELAPSILAELRPKLTMLAFHGTDSLGHYFWPYWEPEFYPDSYKQELPLYHEILPGYYQYMDSVLAEIIETVNKVGSQATVFVISGYGMEPVVGCSPTKRANHDNGTPGILVASGEFIKPGRGWVEDASVYDIAPTVLYLLGYPISEEFAKDKKGRVLTEIISDDFLAKYPIREVSTYGPHLPILPKEASDRNKKLKNLDRPQHLQ